MSLRTNLVVLAAAVALAGCGDDDEARPAAATPTPTATPTAQPTPELTATPAETPSATPTSPSTAPPTPTPGGEGGDEEGNRVELSFDVGGAKVQPSRIEAPAFLGLRLVLRNQGTQPRPVSLDGKALTMVLPGSVETVVVEGLRPGEHALEAAGAAPARIVAVRAGG